MLALALPAMLALAADPLLSLVDTALVGRLGTAPLAALGVCAAVFSTLFWLFNFLAYGTTSEVARAMGSNRPADASRRVVQGLWLALLLGLGVTVLLLAAGPAILSLMGAVGAVREPALAYLRVRALAAVPSLVVMVGHGAYRGLKDTRTPLVLTMVLNLLDAALSWLLIYPADLGVAGAAWGTVIAQSATACAFLLLLRRRLPEPRLRMDRRAMAAILQVSRDLFLRTASLLVGLLLATAAAARMGTVTVAAHQIARELWVLLALVLDGFAIAAQAMIATSLARGETAQARRQALFLLRYGAAAGLVIGVGYLLVSGPLPTLFTEDTAVLREVRGVWVLVALLQPVGGVVFVLDGVFMGAHDYRFLLVSTAVASLGVLAPLAFLALVLDAGLTGVWLGMAALMAVRLLASLWRLGRWDRVAAPAGAAR